MNILLLLAHPTPGSLNHAIAAECHSTLKAMGHDVHHHDLYAERFDPILSSHEIPKSAVVDATLERHCRELSEADGIVVVHPNWWGQPPAILKGWIDRVVRPGVAYRFDEGDSGEGVPVGLLHARTALVFNTGNTSLEREKTVFGDPLERLWRDCIFGLCGVSDVRRRLYAIVVTSTPQERAAWLKDVRDLVASAFPHASQST
jgi:NAD(P)H dehydrogenase (quinone)